MKKICALLAAVMMLLSVMSFSMAESAFVPGTYTATTVARNGELTVSVTVSENAIEAVEVVDHNETVGVTEAAIARVPAEIVATQSLTVDACTGATMTSNAIMRAAQQALTENGMDVKPFLKNVSKKNTSTAVVDKTADVVIVGAGAAGMAAAVSAAQSGAESVIVLETLSTIGGNAMVSGGFLEYMGAPEELLPESNAGFERAIEDLLAQDFSDNELMTSWQNTVREQYAEYKASGKTTIFDSNELLAMQYHVLNLGRPDDSLIGYAEKSHAVCEWFGEMGTEWGPCQIIIGFPWPRWSIVPGSHGGSGYFATLEKNIAEKNLPVEIMLETKGTDLIITDGVVTGVVAKSVDGTTYNVTGKKGVILATGGFASNGDMLVKYNTQWNNMTADVLSDNRQGTDGRGLEMAVEAGAGTAIMDQYMMFPLASPIDGSLTRGINGNFAMYVNKEGKRFVDETLDRNTISQAFLDQEGGMGYIIGDAKNSAVIDGHTTSGESLEFLKQLHAIYEADTIEGLAEQLGMDPAVLRATVDAYNEAVENYNDTEFGRVAFNPECTITEAPFYAAPRTPTVHIILGGLTAAPTGEVISTQGAPIPGLYAVGEITAGGAALSSFADGMAVGRYLFAK